MLNAAGHDAVHAGDLGLLGAADERLLAAAARDHRVLLSADTDFGELLALGRHPGPSVVIFRRAPRRAEAQTSILLANLPEIEEPLTAGAIAVITTEQIRFRLLPIEPRDEQ